MVDRHGNNFTAVKSRKILNTQQASKIPPGVAVIMLAIAAAGYTLLPPERLLSPISGVVDHGFLYSRGS